MNRYRLVCFLFTATLFSSVSAVGSELVTDTSLPVDNAQWHEIMIFVPDGPDADVLVSEVDVGGNETVFDHAFVEGGSLSVVTYSPPDQSSIKSLRITSDRPVLVTSKSGGVKSGSLNSRSPGNNVSATQKAKSGYTVMAAAWCQCTKYLVNRFALKTGYPDAYKWDNGYLQWNLWTNTTVPNPGNIMVLEPGAYGAYSLGHVGAIETSESLDATRWKITLKGANQSGTKFTEYNCTNVSRWILTVLKSDTNKTVSYWYK